VKWVVERLRPDPATRSATITTLQPLTETTYVPCLSLLDFWRSGDALELVFYAHSLDFGGSLAGRGGSSEPGILGKPLGLVGRFADSPHRRQVGIYHFLARRAKAVDARPGVAERIRVRRQGQHLAVGENDPDSDVGVDEGDAAVALPFLEQLVVVGDPRDADEDVLAEERIGIAFHFWEIGR
jgi:hypothetical protein